MGGTTTRKLAVAALAAATSCATTPPAPPAAEAEPFDSCGEICTISLAVVVLIPLIITASVGCVAGGCTRCNEGAPPDNTDPPAPAGETLLPPRGAADTMSF